MSFRRRSLEHIRRWIHGDLKWEPFYYAHLFVPGPRDPAFGLKVFRGEQTPYSVQFGTGSSSFVLLIPDDAWKLPEVIQLPPIESSADIDPVVCIVSVPSEDAVATEDNIIRLS